MGAGKLVKRVDSFMASLMSGESGDPGTAAYNAGKFGLQGFSKALSQEVRRQDIRGTNPL